MSSPSLPQTGRQMQELKRVSRILQMVHLIALNPKQYLRRDLAAHFEVSERMIQKDLEVIRHALCLEVHHCREGYYLTELPRLPALRFSLSEALALVTVVQAARHLAAGSGPDLASALTRLETLFPQQFAAYLRRLLRPVPTTARGRHRHRMIELLSLALIQGHKVRMVYETQSRAGAASERVVRPYCLMPYGRSWHLIAFCEWRAATLMFKLDRIRWATLTDDPYQVPGEFDPEHYLGASWGAMRGEPGAEPVDVVLRFEPQAAGWVSEEYWHPSQHMEKQPDRSMIMHLHVIVTPEFHNWLLYYGKRVEVMRPESLRRDIGRAHLEAATLYGVQLRPGPLPEAAAP